MAITIEGVPDSITRDKLADWLAFIGIDIKVVRSLSVDRDGIQVEVNAVTPVGKGFVINDERARHRISIPVGEPGQWDEPEFR